MALAEPGLPNMLDDAGGSILARRGHNRREGRRGEEHEETGREYEFQHAEDSQNKVELA